MKGVDIIKQERELHYRITLNIIFSHIYGNSFCCINLRYILHTMSTYGQNNTELKCCQECSEISQIIVEESS